MALKVKALSKVAEIHFYEIAPFRTFCLQPLYFCTDIPFLTVEVLRSR